MTLDEAIAHADERAGDETECRREHKQLAGWLRDLKECRATLAELVALKAMKDETQEEYTDFTEMLVEQASDG